MDKAARAEARIKQVCDRLGITPGGRLWMDTALDPFKDIVQRPVGYPDKNMAPSVIQVVHDSIDIAKPADVTGNWDCNIFLDAAWKKTPLRLTGFAVPGLQSLLESTAQGATAYSRGGLVCRIGPAGTPLSIEQTRNSLCLSYVTDVFSQDTSARIIGIGFEVHNTTATLHKQGSVITYRVSDEPSTYAIACCVSAPSNTTPAPYMSMQVVRPPQTASQAIDLPGSLQWEAEKGVYVVPLFNAENNPASDMEPLIITEKSYATDKVYAPQIFQNGVVNHFNIAESSNVHVPITLSGSYFTGLSPETTLTVNLTYYIEQFPAIDSPLKRVSSPSCPEDFAAIELYTKIARELPTGVEVNDNFLGSFISGIARIASAVAPRIPSLINGAASIAGGIGNIASSIDMMSNGPNHLRTMSNQQQQQNNRNNDTVVETQIIRAPANRTTQSIVPLITGAINAITPRQNRTANNTQSTQFRNSGQAIRNRRDPNFNRLDKYMRASNAGNRYITKSKT